MSKMKLTMMELKMTRKEGLLKELNGSLWDLPSASSMSYFWNFGSTLGICLVIQLVTGVFLSFHYSSFSAVSFDSVMMIMKEVWSGWLFRFIHMNGASMFFLFIYLHLFRGLYFKSNLKSATWITGTMIMGILMMISFMGYVLPWGQMSYWAVAVITNLMSVIPLAGDQIVMWVWGGFSVESPTLMRFYSLHFLLPFILSLVVIIHLLTLHKEGSSNPLGVNSNLDKISFHPYFTIKDLVFLMAVILLSMTLSLTYPYLLGDSLNNIPANPMQTPTHIQPEWYFLSSYAILRTFSSKSVGVMALVMSVGIFFVMPMFKLKFSGKFNFPMNCAFWMVMMSFFILAKMGASPAEYPYTEISKIFTASYFSGIILMSM